MRNRFLFLFAASIGLSSLAHAQLTGNLLLRQPNTFSSFVNQVFPDVPNYSTGMGSLVTITGPGWNVSDIQTFQVAGGPNTWWGNVNQAVLTLSHQIAGAPDPSIDPTQTSNPTALFSGIVSISFDEPDQGNQSFRMTANTSAIPQLQGLAAGNYVFSLVPIAALGVYGQTLTCPAAVLGPTDDYIRNPGGAFNFPGGTGWGSLDQVFTTGHGGEWAIGINGSLVPEPSTSIVIVGAMAALLRRRRRR